MPYAWILFDADDTLFHFDAFLGLQKTFSDFNVHFTAEDFAEYQVLNKALWSLYQEGRVTVDQIKQGRFQVWADRLQVESMHLNTKFMDKMAEICTPFEGVVSLLDELKSCCKLGIITNGFSRLQEIRLRRTGLSNHFDLLVISEQVGYAKPHGAIFEYALSKMGNPQKESVLMVGDSLETDILGGINAGLDTCWLNRSKKSASTDIQATYEIESLNDLRNIVTWY